MRWFRKPATPAPTPADHARQLAQVGIDQRRAKIRETARAICKAQGRTVPHALQDR